MADSKDWAGELGTTWADTIDEMDAQLAPATAHGLTALAAQPGERIIDLGCGGGPTTLRIAEAVGQTGHALGVDISADLAAIASTRGAALSQMRIKVADAATHDFGETRFDALFSRFGCMFFDKPVAAFQNLHKALKPAGRVVLCVWAEPKYNNWAMIPASAGNEVLGPVEKLPPGAPGPFGWATPDIFLPILEGAGFHEITYHEHSVRMASGYGAAPDPVDRAIALIERIGPLASRLKEEPKGTIDLLRPTLKEKLTPLVEDDHVVYSGMIRVIQAIA
ncbi:MAG: methyltransferase domain-containing protein [Pseudomonadota bacterium]